MPHKFSLEELAPHQGKDISLIIIDTGLCCPLPKSKVTSIDLLHVAPNVLHPCYSHGQELVDIILGDGNQRKGLAPSCHITMIRAFKTDGTTSMNNFLRALETAQSYKSDVLCLSLKISDALDEKSNLCLRMKTYLQFPWIIAAAGNDGDPDAFYYSGKKLAYPARFGGHIDISVGAYGLRGSHYFVPLFSQHEVHRGPHVLAPGYAIACRNYGPQKKAGAYLLRDGTSYACMFATAYAILILGEFKSDFSKREILKVIKNTAYPGEYGKSLWGIFDIYYTLYVLHVLKSLKSFCNVSLYFDSLLHIITYVIRSSFVLDYNYSLDFFIHQFSKELNIILFHHPCKKYDFTCIPYNKRFEIYREFWQNKRSLDP